MIIRKSLFIPCVLSLLASGSCTRNPEIAVPPIETSNEAEITMALRMPAVYSSEEATADENYVQTLYVLAFRADDGTADGAEIYDYSALAYSVTDAGSSRYKNVKVSLLKKNYPQKLVLIANSKTAVEGLGLEAGTKTKDEVLEMLEFGKADQWHSQMGTFVPIPMWGEAERITIGDNTTSLGQQVVLTRMVSRIDVIKESDIDDDLFTLTSVHLYNRLSNGRVAPHRASTHWDGSEWKAIYPTIPSSNNQKTKGPLKFESYSSGTTSLLPTLYTFEAEAPADDTSADATCVVVGGIYKGAVEPSYYRIDFTDKDDKGNFTGYKHLLRNHIYRVNITDVYGEGHPNPDEAFDSQAVNIDADVKEWDEGSISDVVFDKDYMLGVSQTEYTLPRNASMDNLLYVTTDVPAGGRLTCDASWLTLKQTTFPADTKYEVYFDLEENNTGAPRTAKIVVSAGRLSIVVTVTQGVNEKYSLEITENDMAVQELLFTSYGDEHLCLSRQVKATWTPATEACMVSYFETGEYGLGFTGRLNPFTEAVILGGDKPYTVFPDDITAAERAINPFMEKKSRANLIVGEGSDAIVKTLTMRQVHYDLFAVPEDSYPLDGEEYSFTLTTNAPWTVDITAGNKNLAVLKKPSGDAVPGGEEFKFIMADDEEGKITDLSMTLTFTYTGECGRSATKTVVIKAAPGRGIKDAGDANSYILEPDGEGVSIPLSWANGSEQGQLIGANDDVKVKVLWMDSDRGIADNSVISGYTLKDNGSSGSIEVYPGSQEGNALIAAIVDDEIKWSWHIWVTSYDIEGTAFPTSSNTYMRINLGAITDTKGSLDSYGLLYQFGRKDPFPRRKSATSSGNGQQNLWDEDGNPFVITFSAVTAINNILKSISTPTTFYLGVGGNDNDWTTSSSSAKRRDLWNDSNKKTHYDPCPGGWQTALPVSGTSYAYSDLGTTGTGDANGWIFSGTSSYWPFAGWITHLGEYQMNRDGNSAMGGLYWGSTTNSGGQYAFALNMTQYYPQNNAEIQRASGMSVRCVKEK